LELLRLLLLLLLGLLALHHLAHCCLTTDWFLQPLVAVIPEYTGGAA
jgi:hypothetical protein